MSNSTAMSMRRPIEDLAYVGAVILGSSSFVPAEPVLLPSHTLPVVATENYSSGSSVAVSVEIFPATYELKHLTAMVPEFTDVVRPSQAPSYVWKDEAYRTIDDLASLLDGWDGADSVAATKKATRVATALIREWPGDLPHPELDLLPDGSLVLEVFDDNDFALASIEAKPNGATTYVVAEGINILVSGREDENSLSGITKILEAIRDNVA